MKVRVWPWLIIPGTLALWLIGISWGLPSTYNADEPHIVNLAVSFGAGSLKPAFFKYPTLWPYLLFFFYGIYFVVWSAFGRLHSVTEFIGLYAWHPTGFYLIGRFLAAACGLAALGILAKTGRERRPAGLPWAALLLAVSPVLVESGHSLKPDCLMMIFASGAWLFLLRLFRDGDRRSHWACGLCLGLAVSSQYTALGVAVAAALAHFLSPARPTRRFLWEGLALAAIGFFGGSPYVLLDFPNFWASMRDLSELVALQSWSRWVMTRHVLGNIWNFAGPWSLAGVGLVLGAVRLWRGEKRLALVFLGVIAAYILVYGNNPEGDWPRYLMGLFPGLALLAAEGLSWLEELAARRWTTALLLIASLAPGLLVSMNFDRGLLLADTRRLATDWMRSHVPLGASVLLDMPHVSPDLSMTREEVLELCRRTREDGSPRSRLYCGMADTHPGGGWRVSRIRRSALDVHSSPRHVQLSQADAPMLDVAGGFQEAVARGVEYVVTSSYGATPQRSPELAKFFEELDSRAARLIEFDPVPGRVVGPRLCVYRVGKP